MNEIFLVNLTKPYDPDYDITTIEFITDLSAMGFISFDENKN